MADEQRHHEDPRAEAAILSAAEAYRLVDEARQMREERDALLAAARAYRDAMRESITVDGNPRRCEKARAALFDLLEEIGHA